MISATPVPSSPAAEYRVRRMSSRDAPGVVACIRQIYGDSYVHPELYDPDEIIRCNESLALISVVALDAAGQVVGHYALERPGLQSVAEAGVAMVLPEHRHHQLMERMRELLEQEATRLQLVGLFGHAVTNHTFTQRVDERFHEEPCAVSLGWSPRTFHNMAEPLPQRMSELLYFKYLKKPGEVTAYLPSHHFEWCNRIYAELDLIAVPGRQTSSTTKSQIGLNVRQDLARAVVQWKTVGEDSSDILAKRTEDLTRQGIEVVFLELPLAQAGTPALCLAAEKRGYFFSGIGPSFADDGDVLRLQKLTIPLDPSLILVESQHARELLAYVVAERDRLRNSGFPA